MIKKEIYKYVSFILVFSFYSCRPDIKQGSGVLIFSKTAGFRHKSIKTGVEAIRLLGQKHGFMVNHTENANDFTTKVLDNYRAVIFLNTTGDILNNTQQEHFERYIQAGGGWIGIHSAADTEYKWPWYGKMVGAYFDSHPKIQEAELIVTNKTHPATIKLPDRWRRRDEWYNYKNLSPDVNILLKIDESTYEGGTNGKNHPMAWYHTYDGGRAFYTGSGHTKETYREELFLQHLLAGIKWVMGGDDLDYSKAKPEENRFVITVLDQEFDEPMELDIFSDGRIIFIERKGAIKIHYPAEQATKTIATIPVHHQHEDGLLGIALDPDYDKNNWIYLFYSPIGSESKQHVSRFMLRNEMLDLSSEKVLLEIPVQRTECCHSGGSLEFDSQENLYISVGDNTNPFASDGYAPIDERSDRAAWDARRSSSNPNDLRGKILRIRPRPDGTYSIPNGNLFPPGTAGTRPEIYTMGCRNPFRIHIDWHTEFLYWGDIGPDAGEDRLARGPKGYDEVNQAREPGNFGWPLFVGDNKPYNRFLFADSVASKKYNPSAPINDSPHNTGLKDLPVAQPAFIWYPYVESPDFPLLGVGGRNAMAGLVYYFDDYKNTRNNFPKYYDKKLFIYDWMRGWIMAVKMNATGDFVTLEPFLPGEKFHNPIDMIMWKDGALYVLEYGTTWYTKNRDARLLRIHYESGNRAPRANIYADKTVGGVPHAVQFSAAGSIDLDKDNLVYNWSFTNDSIQSHNINPQYVFNEPGIYNISLTVKDGHGNIGVAKKEILVGNENPIVEWNIVGNSSFYWNDTPFQYSVVVSDAEDDKIKDRDIVVTIDYLSEGFDLTQIQTNHKNIQHKLQYFTGLDLIKDADCRKCHSIKKNSAGPKYFDIAARYKEQENAVELLAKRIINGSGGVWGKTSMAAHPQYNLDEAGEMVKYILSLGDPPIAKRYPVKGGYTPVDHAGDNNPGKYILIASYTDRGANGLPPARTESLIILSPPIMEFENFSEASSKINTFLVPNKYLETMGLSGNVKFVLGMKNNSYIKFDAIDFTGITSLECGLGAGFGMHFGGNMIIQLDSINSNMIGQTSITVPESEFLSGYQIVTIPLIKSEGIHDLYFTFANTEYSEEDVGFLDFMKFRIDKPNLP